MDPSGHETLAALLMQAKRGDTEAFGLIYQRLFTPVYRYALARAGDPELAKDIVQTTFLKAFHALPRFESRGVDPIAFFLTIARNTMLDHWKKRRHETATNDESQESLEAIPDGGESHEDRYAKTSLQESLREALLVLTAEQRDVLSLRFFGERTTEEIARIMKKSPDAVRQLQSRGLRTLRDELKGSSLLDSL